MPDLPAKDPAASAAPSGPSAQPLFSVVSGVVTDSGDGTPEDGLGGEGTVAAATTVRISQIVGGSLELLGEGDIVNGRFDVELPLGLDSLVAQAVDATGSVLGSVIIGASGKLAADVVVAAPITTETSLETSVLLQACACLGGAASAGSRLSLALDISALVDQKLTAAIAAAVAAGVDADLVVQALASAVVASAQARTSALVEAGAELDVDAALKADIAALTNLGIGLSDVLAGNATVADVTAKLFSDLESALSAAADVDATLRVRAQVAASLTFVSSLAASLAAIPQAGAVVFAATHAAAQIEAKLAAAAVKSILELAGASQSLIDAALAAGNKLIADVVGATDIPALSRARRDFVSALVDGLDGSHGSHGSSGGLLGGLLTQTTGTVTTVLQGALGGVGKLAADLDAGLASKLSAIVRADVCIDVDASAELDVTLKALIALLVQFTADVEALGPSLTTGAGPDVTKTLTDLLSTAHVLLRAAP
jgi:hypothetical protein